MNRTQRRALQDAQLDALYAQIPEVKCKGHCHTTCGPIDMSKRERERIAEAGVDIPEVPDGVKLRDLDFTNCPALTDDKRCGVYEIRPFVCRAWGSTELLPCIYGCVPDGGPMPMADEVVLQTEVSNVGGWSQPMPRSANTTAEAVRERIRTRPELVVMARAEAQHGLRADRLRAIHEGLGEHLVPRPKPKGGKP